jgi:GT2 family glycosyltransferase
MPAPQISVVMAVHNGERYLSQAVDSVLAQTLPDFELIIVDDGSTDASPEMLRAYAERDSRVLVHGQANTGRAAALNRAIALSRAPLIARLDADDYAPPERLARQCRFLDGHDAVGLLGGAVSFVDDRGRPFADYRYPLDDTQLRAALERTTPFIHSAATFRSAAFASAGGYRPAFGDADDLDLWLRLSEATRLANLPELMVYYRVHAGQATVRGLEGQTYGAIAARVGARARRAGGADPFATATHIDREMLLAQGVRSAEINAELVRAGAWLARTMGRAGYFRAEEELFSRTERWAREPPGSRALLAEIRSQRARRYAEDGRRLRAKLTRVQAALMRRGS